MHNSFCKEVVNETEFHIITEWDEFVLNADSEGEQKDWVRAVNGAISRTSASPPEPPPREEAKPSTKEFDLRGWLKKAGPKGTGWKRRWFILNGNLLVYFKGPNDAVPQGEIQIDSARIRAVDQTRFNIEVEARIFYLQAATEKEKNDWISTLNAARVHFVKLLASEAMSQMGAAMAAGGGGGAGGGEDAIVSPRGPPPNISPRAPVPDSAGIFGGASSANLSGAIPLSSSSKGEIADIESKPIIKEGSMFKQGGQIKTWKQRWFVLRGHQLYYYKSAADKEPLGVIPLANCKITITEKTSFEVLTGKRNFFLRGNSKPEADSWIAAIEKAASAVSTVDKMQGVIDEDDSPLLNTQVLCEGFLQKEGGKGAMKKWQQRYFVLQGPMLSYYKDRGDLEAAGVIPVGHSSVALAEDKIGKKNSFEIATRYWQAITYLRARGQGW